MVKATPYRTSSGNPRMVDQHLRRHHETEAGRARPSVSFPTRAAAGGLARVRGDLDNIAHLAVPKLADWCSVDLLDERGSITSVAVAHADPSKIEP